MALTHVHFTVVLAGLLLLWPAGQAQFSSFTIDQVNLTLAPDSAVVTGTNVTLQCHVQVSHSAPQRLVHTFSFLLNQDHVLYTKNTSDSQVEFSLTPARAASSGRYVCHVQVLEKERSSQELRLSVSGLLTPTLSVSSREVSEGEEVTVSCLAPGEEGTLISQIYINNTYEHSITSEPPGKEFSITKLLRPGRSQIHCKNSLQRIITAGQSNLSNVVTVTVHEMEITPTISFEPPSGIFEGDLLRVNCSVPKFSSIAKSERSKLELLLTKGGRILKQDKAKEVCALTLRTGSADSGTYTCKAEIGNLQKSSTGTATVAELFSVPKIVVSPPVVFEGDNFTVSCFVESVADQRVNRSIIEYQLFRNQRELQRGQRYMATAGSAHDGVYFCLAKAREIPKNSTEVLVKARMLPSTPTISVEGAVILGRPFQVLCRTQRGSLPITFILVKGQRSIEVKQQYSLFARFNVSAIMKQRELQEFSCQAQNDPTRPTGISSALQAPVIEPVSMLKLTLEPHGGGVTEGSDLKLTCNVHQGSPPFTFTFFHSPPGAPASWQQLTQTRLPGTSRASYTVRAIGRHQAGQYKCHAANSANEKNSTTVQVHVKLAPWKVALMTVCVILLVAGVGVLLLILIKGGGKPCKRTKRTAELSVKPAKTKSNDPQRVSLVLEEQPAPNATPGMLGRSVWSAHMSVSASDSETASEDEHSVEVQYSEAVFPPPIDPPTPSIPDTEPMTNGTETEYSQVKETANADIPTQTEGASLEYAQLNHSDPEPE